ncbi:conserved hypothetical protein [Pseudomonas knackmussii B13]|uniref:HNH nuclease domain-containing protein n=1 Tax=Pseudomonas knackmussii (strain DSM 6978 / CCUG 54928 / LMG 23759 / B13) TaxID=1301098 RepID=A0A024HNX8_PSEKB|nr:HNH endonuclease signature motif containing protein [Pseudomonas knackmussii]CDF86369.1 conserved hypothetical protein [Pseudomonas knackmussii B13]
MKKRWLPADDERLRELYGTQSAEEVAELLGRTLSAVVSRASSLGLGKRPWTKADEDQLREIYPRSDMADICRITGRTTTALRARAAILGIKRVDSPNRRLANQRHSEYLRRCREEGFRNSTTAPIGAEAVHGGKLYRKVADTGDSHQDWKLMHRVIWEEVNGPIPEGNLVVFRDGNTKNLTIENLELITKAERMRRHSIARYPREIHSAAVALGFFRAKLKRLETENEEPERTAGDLG